MNEIIRIHIAGVPYEIDADAKKQLTKYMDAIKDSLGEEKDALEDIEIRVTEILSARGVNRDDVIRISDVKAVKEQLGDPHTYASDEKDGKKGKKSENLASAVRESMADKKYFRDTENGIIGGVVAGLAAYTGWDVTLLRVLYIVLLFCTGFFPLVILYIVAMIVAPEARTVGDRLSMKGEPVNLETIKESAKDFADKTEKVAKQASAKIHDNGPQITNAAVRVILGFFGVIGFLIFIPSLIALIPATILTIITITGAAITLKPLFIVTVVLGFVFAFTIISTGLTISSALINAKFTGATAVGILTSAIVAISVAIAASVTGSIWVREVGYDEARETMKQFVHEIRVEVDRDGNDRVRVDVGPIHVDTPAR